LVLTASLEWKESRMDKELDPHTPPRTASQEEVAEVTMSRQAEDHTLPAKQVLGEQPENAGDVPPTRVFIP
jgi:hypothetical protein